MIFGAPSASSAIHHGVRLEVAETSARSPLDFATASTAAWRAEMRDIGHGEAEMKPRRIPHRGFADRNIRMHRERRLHVGEGRDDDAPDALDGVERQDAAMALHQPPHHVGLARRAERRADFLGLLDLDQAVDDVAARHQQAVHLLVDRCRSPCAAPASEGGAGGGLDMLENLTKMLPHPEERRLRRVSKDEARSPSWFETAQGRLLSHEGPRDRLTTDACLDEKPPGTSFNAFRGHLSRPACSHVKQLAKQAGDRS